MVAAVRVMASRTDEMSDEENENNSDIAPIEVAIDAGATLSKPASASISRKRKIHVNEGILRLSKATDDYHDPQKSH